MKVIIEYGEGRSVTVEGANPGEQVAELIGLLVREANPIYRMVADVDGEQPHEWVPYGTGTLCAVANCPTDQIAHEGANPDDAIAKRKAHPIHEVSERDDR